MSLMVRQGDVLLEQIEEIPQEAVQIKPKGRRYILVEGEATGHHHSVGLGAAVFMLGAQMLLRTEKGCTLEHQEHGPIKIAPGNYRITRQREYHPSELRMVAD